MKIKLPEGMLEAADQRQRSDVERRFTKAIVEAVLLWISENPIVPTDEQIRKCAKAAGLFHWCFGKQDFFQVRKFFVELQRMFLQPEPEVPEAVEDLILHPGTESLPQDIVKANEAIIEAYNRGRKSV